MVKNTVGVERLVSLENNINSTIVLKVRTSVQKFHILVCNYRQWKGTSPHCNYNSRNENDAILRFKDMIDIWEKLLILGTL